MSTTRQYKRPGKCSVEGCASETIFAVRLQMCLSHYRALRRYGKPELVAPQAIEERIKRFMAPQPNGCIEWTGGIDTPGYGAIRYEGKRWRAHRLIYTLFRNPIPERKILDHLCRNRRCVNLDHLELTTQSVNIARSSNAFAKQREATHCRRGHPFDLFNTAIRNGRWRVCKSCSEERRRKKEARSNA